jgi:hypothetical protein
MRMPKKELEHIRIIPGEKGGVNIEHHFTAYEHKPESFPFGKTEGAQAMAHIAQHSGIEAAEPGAGEEEEEA